MTHICVGKLTINGSDNGLSPGRRQAIIWTNYGILLIRPLGTQFSEILIGIQTFSFKKIYLKMSSAKWRRFCLGLNVLMDLESDELNYTFSGLSSGAWEYCIVCKHERLVSTRVGLWQPSYHHRSALSNKIWMHGNVSINEIQSMKCGLSWYAKRPRDRLVTVLSL